MSNPRLSCERQSLDGESMLHDVSKLAVYAAGQRQLRRTAGELCDLAGNSEPSEVQRFCFENCCTVAPSRGGQLRSRVESVEGLQ